MAAEKKLKEQNKIEIQSEPDQEQIRTRAYEIYLAREGGPGDELADWLQAEAELRRRPIVL